MLCRNRMCFWFFFFSSRRRHTRLVGDWSSDVCSSDLTSWQIDGETVETVSDFILGGSKITSGGDRSHEIKRCLLLGRKVTTNLDSIFKSRDITLPTKVCLVKAMVFQWSCMDVRVGL